MKGSIKYRAQIYEYILIQRELAIRKARKNFWSFCCLLYPEFYKENKPYLKELCHALQAFYKNEIDKPILIVNMPPRHGKTFTARLFILWVFGQNSKTKVMTGSYNQILSSLFAQQTRDGIMVENENIKQEYFNDIFPEVKIKQGDAARGFWSLDGSEEKNYLATSPNGTATGIGANIVLVDDIIKSAYEAYNELILEKHWQWYNNTLVQRMERPRKQILMMTRWSTGDLAGRMMESKGDKCHVITYKAVQDGGTMLCDEIMTKQEYEDTIADMGIDIASANYQQEPIDIRGKLYSSFKTYETLPVDNRGDYLFTEIRNYTDTADEGDNYFCSINYGVYNQEAYVLNVLYTKDPMEITEPKAAKMLFDDQVDVADYESNNGGRGCARAVKRILQEEYKSNHTKIKPFFQSKNKKARIISNATWVMDHIYFPVNWKDKWPEYYKAMMKYQREGRNEYDDAPDATTGIAEKLSQGRRFSS